MPIGSSYFRSSHGNWDGPSHRSSDCETVMVCVSTTISLKNYVHASKKWRKSYQDMAQYKESLTNDESARGVFSISLPSLLLTTIDKIRWRCRYIDRWGAKACFEGKFRGRNIEKRLFCLVYQLISTTVSFQQVRRMKHCIAFKH